jgi:ATP-binding protein involved in chromosome partitioning
VERLRMGFEEVKHLILVASGKGGVGKSTVATNLALALADRGARVGLLDADVYGPSIPTMLGDAPVEKTPDGTGLLPVERHGIKAISMGYLVSAETAMIWRGPMLASAVTQLVNDVAWGPLDYVIFDLPPGTGDVQLTLAQKLRVTGSVLVTTPQPVALADVMRAKAMFDRVRIQTLGLVENMAYFVCPDCQARHEIFSCGGGEQAAKELEIPFLGRVPIEAAVREAGDAGVPVVRARPDAESAKAFRDIAAALATRAEAVQREMETQDKRREALRIITR